MVHIKQIPMIKSRTGEYKPIFLTDKDDHLLLGAIEEFDQLVEGQDLELSKESIIDQFSNDDYKIGLCVYETLSNQFYPFSKINSQIAKELGNFRLILWNLINQEFNGVVTDELSKKKVLKKFRDLLPSKYHKWQISDLNDWIFSDYSNKQRRSLPAIQPTPKLVRQAVNSQTLKILLKNSEKVELTIPVLQSLSSKQVKWLFYLSKRFGVFSTIEKTKSGSKITITGPEELIGRREKYGRKIYTLVNQIIEKRKSEAVLGNWSIEIHIPWGKGKRRIFFSFKEIPELVSTNDKDSDIIDFDSKTEEKFFQMLTVLKPWIIIREPVILEKNLVFLPDFSLHFSNIPPIYIEVIGFWTEDYLTKKFQKLTELAKSSLTIILIVDSCLDVPENIPFAVFLYHNNKFNQIIVPLNKYLKEEFLDPYNKKRIEFLSENTPKAILGLLSTPPFEGLYPEKMLLETFKLSEEKKLQLFLTKETVKKSIKENNWKYFKGVGLVQKNAYTRWKKLIAQEFLQKNTTRLPLSNFKPIFPLNVPEVIIPKLLRYYGYKVRWEKLQSITVTK